MQPIQSEQPDFQDVMAHALIAGGADPLDHFLATIIDMPPWEFNGGTVIEDPRVRYPDVPVSDFAHADRCFIGNAIVKAPERIVPNERGSLDEVSWTARVYDVPRDVVQWIYGGVVGLTFAGAVEFAQDTVAAQKAGGILPEPGRYEHVDSADDEHYDEDEEDEDDD